MGCQKRTYGADTVCIRFGYGGAVVGSTRALPSATSIYIASTRTRHSTSGVRYAYIGGVIGPAQVGSGISVN
jgi:hypothetical protein